MKRIQHGYAIAYKYGLFSGWSFTRQDAIANACYVGRFNDEPEVTRYEAAGHKGRSLSKNQKIIWARMRKNGHRAVKVRIHYVWNETAAKGSK